MAILLQVSAKEKMAVDQIAALQLLSDLFLSIAGQLNRLKGTPKQRFARELIALFDILEQAEQNISGIVSSLSDFNNEKAVGMQVHYIHRAGALLDEFSRTCGEFTQWVDRHENLSNALQILAPKTKEILAELDRVDMRYTKGSAAYVYLKQTVNALRENLQATRSPDPKKFPTFEFVVDTIDRLSQISSQIGAAKQLLREFASTKLTVEDFF